MKKTAIILALGILGMAACSNQDSAPPPSSTQKPAELAEPAEPAKPRAEPVKVTTPERISEIEASGQIGLWSSVADVCASDVKNGLRTTLTWNVKDSGAAKVVVYVVDKGGEERHFGQGGPVGEKETGPWLRPGITFRIRDIDSKADLGTVVIAEKPAC